MDKSSGAGWRMRPPYADARQQRAVDADPQWPTTMMAVGILVFIMLFWTVGQRTLITFTDLFRWFALFAFAGNFLPRQWVQRRFAMDRLEWFWFNLLAIGPLLFACCLLLNFLVHGPERKMLVHGGHSFDLHEHWRVHGTLPPHLPWPSDFGTIPEKDKMALSTARTGDVVFGLARGSLGYLVVTSRQPVEALMPDN